MNLLRSLQDDSLCFSRVFQRKQPLEYYFGLFAASLVLASLALNLGLGRSGSYIGTPVRGLFLADLLLALGALLSLTQMRKVALISKTAWVFVFPAVYLLGNAVFLAFRKSDLDYFLWVRDMAPFAYLSLVPLIALSLQVLKPQMLVIVIRWAALIYSISYAATYIDLLSPIPTAIIASDSVLLFEYRSDLTGFVLGIGIVAWGRWNVNLSRNIYIQGVLLAIGLTSSSRSAFLTLIVLSILSLLKDWSNGKILSLGKMLVGAMAAVLALSFASFLQPLIDQQSLQTPVTPINEERVDSVTGLNREEVQAGSDSVTGLNREEVQAGSDSVTGLNREEVQAGSDSVTWVPPSITKFTSLYGAGTASARLDTASDILVYLGTGTNWLTGSGPGTDALYFACTGISIAPERTIKVINGQETFLPKCAVDTHGAPSTLRDPHNWVLNILLYHGVIGLIILLFCLVIPLWVLKSVDNYRLTLFGVIGLLVVGTFGVILSAPFGLVPLTVLLSYVYANALQRRIIENGSI